MYSADIAQSFIEGVLRFTESFLACSIFKIAHHKLVANGTSRRDTLYLADPE